MTHLGPYHNKYCFSWNLKSLHHENSCSAYQFFWQMWGQIYQWSYMLSYGHTSYDSCIHVLISIRKLLAHPIHPEIQATWMLLILCTFCFLFTLLYILEGRYKIHWKAVGVVLSCTLYCRGIFAILVFNLCDLSKEMWYALLKMEIINVWQYMPR